MDNALGYNDNTLTDNEHHVKQKAQSCCDWEGGLYNALEETQPNVEEDGSVIFCQHFKYHGSFVSFNSATTMTLKNKLPLPPNQWEPSRTSGTPPTLTFGANVFSSVQSP
jgi:hypothetical protein